jgi:hypothetical protein
MKDILCIRHEEKQYKIYPAHVKIRNLLKDLDVDGRIILNSIFKKGGGQCGVVLCFR